MKNLDATDALHWAFQIIELGSGQDFEINPEARPYRPNVVFRLIRGDKSYYLNLRHVRSDEGEKQHRARYLRELAALRSLPQLAPTLIGYFEQKWTILTASLDGIGWPAISKHITEFLPAAFISLHQLHKIPPPTCIAECGDEIHQEILTYIFTAAGLLTDTYKWSTNTGSMVWLHGNPNLANAKMSTDGKVRWLDWEDTHLGPPEFDFAYLSAHLSVAIGLSITDCEELLEKLDIPINFALFEDFSRVIEAYVLHTEKKLRRYT